MIKTMKVMTALTVTLAVGTALAVGTCMIYRATAKSKKYTEGVSCPKCHDYLTDSQKERFAMRQKQILIAKKTGKKHIFQKEYR